MVRAMEGNKITYHQQVSFCGKARCRRCREGIGHGPYWYAYQTVNGRTVRTYIGKNAPAAVLAAQGEPGGTSQEFANTLLRLHVLGQFRLEQRCETPANDPQPAPRASTRGAARGKGSAAQAAPSPAQAETLKTAHRQPG